MNEIRRALGPVLGLLLIVLLLASCGTSASKSVTATILIEADPATSRWVDGVVLPDGGNGYELLETAVGGELEAEFFFEFGSHFVWSILGIEAKGSGFWGVFIWNTDIDSWEPLAVGADLFDVEDGQIMAWTIVEFDTDRPQLPVSQP